MYENRNGVEIYYTYSLAESISNFIQPYSFEIDGVKYFYEFDGGITVTGLKNEANELVFRYEYEKGLVSKIFQKNCEGTWEDVTNDKYTAGHINRLRYCGYYFDEETQWYYCGRLYDPTSESFVDYGLVSPIASAYAVSGDVPAAVFNQAFIFYENCMSNTSFGRPIESYSSTWFSGLSEIEVLARTIYGENTYSDRHNDRQAVGWIIVNRYNNERFEDTIGGVCTEAAQFESVTGNEARTANARCPSTTSAAWSEAVSIASNIMACKSYGSNFTAYLEGLMPRPDGITDQLFFVGLEWFKVASTDGTSGLKYNFGTAAGHVDISKVVVVDVDTNITSKAELNNIASPYKYNVFFYYSP